MRFSQYYWIILLSFVYAACNANVNTFAGKISATQLKKDLEVIASDSLEGREMASEGERKASRYIAATFKKLNLLPAPGTDNFLQSFDVTRDSIIVGNIHVDTAGFDMLKHAFIIHFPDTITYISSGRICFAGYGIEDEKYNDYAGLNPRGSVIAILAADEPMIDSNHYLITGTANRSDWSIEKKLAVARKKGARAVIILQTRFDTIPDHWRIKASGDYYLPSAVADTTLPYVYVDNTVGKAFLGEKFGAIAKLGAGHQKVSEQSFITLKKFDLDVRKTKITVKANNVAGYIEGTDKKDEYVIVSAHYDHLGKHDGEIYHGADDNGSGTCGLLGIAKAFSEAAEDGFRPRRSILFLSVTGEEKGLFGSKSYVAHPCFPLSRTVVDINTDMIGRCDPNHEKDSNYIYVIGDDRLSSELREINERNNANHIKLTLDYRYDSTNDPNKFYYRSDHYQFAKKHIPIIFYFDGIHKDYHKPSDTIEKIDFDLMERRSRLAFYTTWEIANRESRLKADKSEE